MDTNTIWTKEELLGYILIYAAHADYEESSKEHKLLTSKLSVSVYEKMKAEFDADSDYQSIQKILYNLGVQKYSKKTIDSLFEDLKTLFLVDGNFDILERNMLMFLKRIIK